jgi:hypothetical protein
MNTTHGISATTLHPKTNYSINPVKHAH